MTPRLLPSRHPDASMDLLNQILRQPVDPDYRLVAERERAARRAGQQPPRAPRFAFAAVVLLIGAMFAIAAVQTTRSAPAATAERAGLIEQIRAGERRQDELRVQLQTLRTENEALRRGVLAGDDRARQDQAGIDVLAPAIGDTAVKGPGVLVIVDDAPVAREDRLNRVLDRDLQQLANGLRMAGAEAIAINGHRLTARTAIRSAGEAITVDYRSLTRPYRIEAIGDQRVLAARLAESQGGRHWLVLQQNYQLRYEISQAKELTLPGDPGFGIREARRLP